MAGWPGLWFRMSELMKMIWYARLSVTAALYHLISFFVAVSIQLLLICSSAVVCRCTGQPNLVRCIFDFGIFVLKCKNVWETKKQKKKHESQHYWGNHQSSNSSSSSSSSSISSQWLMPAHKHTLIESQTESKSWTYCHGNCHSIC